MKNSYKTDNNIIMNKKELNRELNSKPNLVNKTKNQVLIIIKVHHLL